MSELKTRVTDSSVEKFLNSVEDLQREKDSREMLEIMSKVTGEKPKMWGSSIIGFGSYHYKYESGTEGDWFLTGFSPRKQALTVYIMAGFDKYDVLMKKLGKYKTGKSCLYIKKLEDVDKNVLEELIRESVKHMREKYGRSDNQ